MRGMAGGVAAALSGHARGLDGGKRAKCSNVAVPRSGGRGPRGAVVRAWPLRAATTPRVCAILALAGCGGLPPQVKPEFAERELPTQVVADWDDVWTACWAAGPRVEMTVAHGEHVDETTQFVELVSTRDEVCILRARRDPVPAGTQRGSALDRGESVTIYLEFELGRFGDPAREWAFLTDLVDRLEDLRGVGAAPIRWDAR